MIPFEYQRLAKIIHEERIQAALRRQPEWAYTARHSRQAPSFGRSMRRAVAQLLHVLAARVERGTRAAPERAQPAA